MILWRISVTKILQGGNFSRHPRKRTNIPWKSMVGSDVFPIETVHFLGSVGAIQATSSMGELLTPRVKPELKIWVGLMGKTAFLE